MEQNNNETARPPRAVLIELAYNTLGNYLFKMQQDNNLSHNEIGTVLLKLMQDNQSAQLIEASSTIAQLTQKLNSQEGKEDGNTNN